MNSKWLFIFLCACGVLAGCRPNAAIRKAMERAAPDEDEALAKKCLTALSTRDFETIRSQLDPQFVTPGIESELSKMASALDHGEPLSVELVGCNVVSISGRSSSHKRRSNLTYQCQFPDWWVLASFTIDTVDGNKRVYGINVQPIPESLGEINAFTFVGKDVPHYAMLALAVALPLFSLYALIVCIRTRLGKVKWFWMLFVVVGFGKLGLNWTTGRFLFSPISINVPASSAFKQGLYTPWIVTISLPLGAILFLLLRKRLARVQSPPVVDEEPQPIASGDVPDEPLQNLP